MPCGGIHPASDVGQYECWVCNKPGSDHFIWEWDAAIHAKCIPSFLSTEEGRVVIEHKHLIQIGDLVLQAEGEATYVDPDACLEELRKAIEACTFTTDEGAKGVLEDSGAFTVIEKFKELDEWLKRGGFLPKDWRHED